jgi:pimeloyl-ACP methyl ester carboxylesterase
MTTVAEDPARTPAAAEVRPQNPAVTEDPGRTPAAAEVRPQNPAVVRFHLAPRPVRAAFRVLERIAPALGARWAERIWFTLPRRGQARTAGGAGPALGEPFAIDLGGRSVVGETYGHGPAVYLMHGWAGHRGHLAAFVAPLVGRGYRVVTFDAPSHGASGPGGHGSRSSSLPEFVQALSAVVEAHGPARAVIAHSMGATAAATALSDGLRAGRLAMLAPMASPDSYSRQFAVALGFGERTARRLMARIEQRIGAPMHLFDALEHGRAVAMPPTLIVHDRDDASISVNDGMAIAAAWSQSRLTITSGLGHRRLLRDPHVVDEVVEFVTG